MKLSAEKGSNPLEVVVSAALLLLPVLPIALLYQQLISELAAESIARHALRAAVLASPEDPGRIIGSRAEELADNWNVELQDLQYWCTNPCELANLLVQVSNAQAIATMGLEP